jgi:hypothetical protein
MGFDTTLGLPHNDKRYRLSLASDLMEPVRPVADRIAFELLRDREFSRGEVVETRQGVCAFEAVKGRGQQAVGVSNSTDFLRPHSAGRLNVSAVAIQQGRTQQLWQVEIRRPEDEKLVARGQVRLQNIEARK